MMRPTHAWEQAVKSAPENYSIVTTFTRVFIEVNGEGVPREAVVGRAVLDASGKELYKEAVVQAGPSAA